MSSNNSMKKSFGSPESENAQTTFQVQLELLTQKNRYLQQVKELTAMYGAETVREFMHLGGLISIQPNSRASIGMAPSDTKSEKSSGADLIGEVEALGLKLNPLLIDLLAKSTVKQVKTATAKYKTYQQVRNPEGLFYRILSNE